MEALGTAEFEKGRAYTRGQIHAAVGGNRRAALPTRGGRVVCLCLTRARNPRAPEEVVIGPGAGQARVAREFAASGAAVPVFVRAPRGGWEYAGERRVRALIEDPGAILALVAEGAPADASLALLLEESPGAPAAPGPAVITAAGAAG
ncbi:MAG TPA: hypothetical protein VI078_13315 [bacterium]